MTNLIIVPGQGSDFTVAAAPQKTPTAAEQDFIDTLGRVNDALADDERADSSPNDRAGIELRRRAREAAITELRGQANQVCNGQLDAAIAADNVLVIKGKYVAARDRISNSLFAVAELMDKAGKFANELYIRVASGLPPPNDVPSPEKQALYVALDSALTVVKTVSARVDAQKKSWWKSVTVAGDEATYGEKLLDTYVRKLAGIGRLGLQGPHVQLANLALLGVKAEFVAHEAGRIKNTYIRRLGVACGVGAALSFLLYAIVVGEFLFTGAFWMDHRTFLLAAGGACIGTWLSFSIRRVTLSFDELGILEEDLLDPSIRVIFVVALTLTACLLFWTNAINVSIGDLQTAQLQKNATSAVVGEIAVLVGIFCGIAERGLATAVSGRAAAFAKSIAGGG